MPFTWNDLLRRIAWWRVSSAFALALVSTLAAFAIFRSISQPETFAVVNARSEYLEYRVFNPELAMLHGEGLRIAVWPDGQREDQCAGGTFLPEQLATVTYQRIENGPLQISMEGKGTYRTAEGGSDQFDGEVVLYPDPACGSLVSSRFPIWGPGKIGSAFSVRGDGPGPILLSGTLEVFGRTVSLGPFGKGGAVYASTAQPLTIPSGGFIQSDRRDGDETTEVSTEMTALFGYILLSEEPGFAVHVTTETPLLQVFTPGTRENTNRIEIGLFAQVLNDPNILRAQIFFLLLFLFLPVFIDLTSLALSRDGEDEERAEKPMDQQP